MATNKKQSGKESGLFITQESVVVGVIVGMNEEGLPMVSFPGCLTEQGIIARTTVVFGRADIGRQVALLFEAGDTRKPMVIGRIQIPGAPVEDRARKTPVVEATLDGERLVLSADREIVLKCGKASITLTRAGKIILRGAYLLNRSSGVNKIKGASVQIN